jgi:hypothetical protein
MAMDLKALARAAEGDQNVKVSVGKPWLREVHRPPARCGSEG